jgi:hypothetical protein
VIVPSVVVAPAENAASPTFFPAGNAPKVMEAAPWVIFAVVVETEVNV